MPSGSNDAERIRYSWHRSTGFTIVKVVVRTRARPESLEKWRDKVGFDIENFLSFRTDNEMDNLGDNVFPINGNVQGDFWFSSLF